MEPFKLELIGKLLKSENITSWERRFLKRVQLQCAIGEGVTGLQEGLVSEILRNKEYRQIVKKNESKSD